MAKQFECKKCLEEFEGNMGVCPNCDTDKHTFAPTSDLVDWLNEIIVAALNNQEARLSDLEDEVDVLKLRLNELQAKEHRRFKGSGKSTTDVRISTNPKPTDNVKT